MQCSNKLHITSISLIIKYYDFPYICGFKRKWGKLSPSYLLSVSLVAVLSLLGYQYFYLNWYYYCCCCFVSIQFLRLLDSFGMSFRDIVRNYCVKNVIIYKIPAATATITKMAPNSCFADNGRAHCVKTRQLNYNPYKNMTLLYK